MYKVVALYKKDLVDQKFTNKINAFNFMYTILASGDHPFLMNTTFPSAYKEFMDAYKLIKEYYNVGIWEKVEILEQLEKLYIKQNINVRKELLTWI